jgi:hypothetical protein
MLSILTGKHPNTLSARAILPPHQPKPGVPFDEGPEVGILQLNGEDDDAQVLTVIVEPVFDERLLTGGLPHRFPLSHGPCVAIVEWGTGAVTCRAEVDIAKGTCFSIAASSINIRGRNDGRVRAIPLGDPEFPPPPTPIDPAPAPQSVVAMLAGAGTRAAFGRATRTFYLAALNNGGTYTFPVPPFAKSLVVQRTPANAVGVSARAGFGASGVTRDGEYVIPAGTPSPRIDLIDVADSILVRNVGPGQLAFVQAQFELAL